MATYRIWATVKALIVTRSGEKLWSDQSHSTYIEWDGDENPPYNVCIEAIERSYMSNGNGGTPEGVTINGINKQTNYR